MEYPRNLIPRGRNPTQAPSQHGQGTNSSRRAGYAPSNRKPDNFQQTLRRLEEDAENHQYEIIRLRTLVLKLEKEREDGCCQIDNLKQQNNELERDLTRALSDVQQLKRENNELRCRQWMEGAQGLSTIRAAILAVPSSPSPYPSTL
eukprot:CAMPEP_0175072882 /NCGR_PEP_ID=MMETSP0052_2-20121109/20190_1 /TAXON_ID=51329 ORGANISM="Polytomella parva, Strain SAG 63-3" /NCGR_SAMPLE_ID=MMETSP0052_2 /ASSEMBLY_ACC=CAM_ASM_000194 /LENGTH=146 /DNA_ID=CAMNT_0016340503 /DNA_START=160 /DNA_END=597 /DNA_ORIENTATION=+